VTPRDVWVVVDRADNPVCVERTEGRARRETAGEHVHKYILATTLDAEREQAKHLEDDRDKYEVKARAYGTMVFIYREALEAIAAPKSTGDTAIDTARNALARRHAGFGHGLTDRDLAAFDALCVAERERIRVEERERIRGEVTSECITTLWKLGHTDAATALRESLADEAIRARGKDAGRSVLAIAPAPDAADEETYPCRHPGCDVRRTKAEGGTTFTVCDEHWTKPTPAAKPRDISLEPGTREVRVRCEAHPDAPMRRFGDLARCSECGEAIELCLSMLGQKGCVLAKGHGIMHTSPSGSSWPVEQAAKPRDRDGREVSVGDEVKGGHTGQWYPITGVASRHGVHWVANRVGSEFRADCHHTRPAPSEPTAQALTRPVRGGGK